MPLFFLSFLHHHFLRRIFPINLALSLCLVFTLTLISHPSFANPSNQNTINKNTVNNVINDIQLKFSKFSANEGLTSNNIFDISQDAQGYLWIATEDGLNRFDGQKIESYRHNINDTFSISDNLIRKVFIDNNNTLWVGTRNGLSRYNRELDNFDNFHHEKNDKNSLKDNIVWDIYQDNNENLWVSTSLGIQKLSIAKDLTESESPSAQNVHSKKLIFNTVTFDGFNKELTEVKTIYQDSQGNYWFGSYDTGIHLVNKNFFYNGSLLTDNKYNLSIDANSLFDIKEIDDKIWLATDNGIYIIDHHYQLVSHISATKNTSHNSHSKDNSAILLSDHIRAIEKYDDNHIWVATQKGLNIVSLTDGSISSHQKNAYNTSLSDNWIMDVFRDKNGTMWLGSYGGGLNKYSPLNDKLYHGLSQIETSKSNTYRVESFTQASDGKVYLSTEQQGIFSVDKSKNVSKPFIAPAGVRQVLSDNLNNLWLVTRQRKLFQYNLLSQTLLQHETWHDNSNYEQSNKVKIIDHYLWYISQSGLLTRYDTVKQSFNYYPNTAIAIFSKLQKDQGSTLWLISDDNKLLSFDTRSLTFSTKVITLAASLQSKQISSIAIDKQNIWLGTYSRGVTLIDSTTGNSTVFNEGDGLPNKYNIASILIDDDSNAWVASNKGISVITAQSKSTLHFYADFLAYKPEFITRSNLKSNSGEFYLGSTRGFYKFSPKELLNIKQSISQPLFTNLYIANKQITIKPLALQIQDFQIKDSPIKKRYTLNKQLNSLKQVILEHDHPAVSFGFVSPNTKLPQQLSYRYRLQGLEDEWVDADKSNLKATYTNLAPGYYTLEVQAYDSQSFEESTVNQLKVQILPPWWLSTGAIFIYLLISLLLLSFVFQQLHNRRLYHLQIKENEERLKLSLWGSGDEMWDWNMLTGKVFRSNIWGKLEFPQDGSRNILSPNSLSPDILPTDENDTSEIPKKGNIHQHDIAKVKYALEQHTLGFSDHYEAAYRVQDKDNAWVWVLDRGKIVGRDENEKPIRMTGTLKDISQLKNTEERLRLFAKCIENISDAIVIYDKEFITVDVNKAFVKITGETKELVLGQPLEFNQYPLEFCQNIKQHLITKGRWHGEIESLHYNNEKYFTDLNIDVIHDENDNVSHFVSVFSDITKRKTTEKELRRLASSDTLTGLPNRAFFQVQQTKLVKKKTPHALLVFDLDNFKKINDSLGHQVGDDILCKIAKRILPIARKQDSVYRLGGDEFSILIENTNDINTITTISNEVLKKVAMPFKLKSQEIVLFSSIGIVLYPDDGVTPHELLKNADTAMYHAKNAGGNRYQFFNESMNKAAVHRLQVETLIRHGLRENSFSVFYQPKISIATGQISGMEALVRFITPANGFVSPAVFIPVSEETGQIIDIGEIVLRKACFSTKKWVDEGLFNGRVAVNLSAVQFTQANLVDLIANILTESRLPAKYLELEITEGTVMDAPQKAIETMEQIRAMGVHLSLDDFGTGYSSLSYLKRFPLNTLKIDKAFIDDIEISEQGRNMVATIVTIAHNLEMKVVAEGVETQPQLDFLATLNCDQLQGYLYSKPLPTSNFHQYLISHKVTNQSTSFSQSY